MSTASAADHCRPRTGERELGRSAQAIVFEHIVKDGPQSSVQTVIGCSRRSGRRRTIETLQRRSASESVKLIGLRLAGTRVAYVMYRGSTSPILMADDALHGGRRHDLRSGPMHDTSWPFGRGTVARGLRVSWAVDALGDVAWITTESLAGFSGAQSLGVWRGGLGRRQVDANAGLRNLTLRDGVLHWQHSGTPRLVDLTSLPPSRCGALNATVGTLDVDLVPSVSVRGFTACLRSTGQTVAAQPFEYEPSVADINGPYVALSWMHKELRFTTFLDLARGIVTTERGGSGDMVVTEHGSLAWIDDSGLWARDASGTRKIAESGAGTGPLVRDGSTVTWAGGGPTVTLDP